MTKPLPVALALVMGLACLPGLPARADVIPVTVTIPIGPGVSTGDLDQFRSGALIELLVFGLPDTQLTSPMFDPSFVGTVTFLPGDPGFDAFAAAATSADPTTFQVQFGDPDFGSLTQFSFGRDTLAGGPLLAGNRLDAVEFVVRQFSIDRSGEFPTLSYDFDVRLIAGVPEPSSVALVASALPILGLALRRARRGRA